MYMAKQRVKSVQRIFLTGKRHKSENMYLQYIGRGKMKCQTPFEVSKYSLTSNLIDTCQSVSGKINFFHAKLNYVSSAEDKCL